MKKFIHSGDEEQRKYPAHRPSTQRKMMLEELRNMSIEELEQVSKEKAPNGCATKYALEAQKMLYKKKNWGY